MPQEPNKALRIIAPILILIGIVFFGWAVGQNTAKQGKQRAASEQKPEVTPADGAAEQPGGTEPEGGTLVAEPPAERSEPEAADAGATTPIQSSVGADPAPAAAPTPAPVFSARTVPVSDFDSVGGLSADGPYEMQLRFASRDAGISELALANYFQTVKREQPQVIQRLALAPGGNEVSAFGAIDLEVNRRWVRLWAEDGEQIWEQTAPGTFAATIVDGDGTPAFRITRRFVVSEGSFEVRLVQTVENVSDQTHSLRWIQFGPIDLPVGSIAYGGDKRRVRFGYIYATDQTQTVVSDDGSPGLRERRKVIDSMLDQAEKGPSHILAQMSKTLDVWPTRDVERHGYQLAWAGLTGQYFALAVYSDLLDQAGAGDRRLSAIETVQVKRIGDDRGRPIDQTMLLRFAGPKTDVPPGGTLDASLRIYAGPNSERLINAIPAARAVNLERLVIYLMSSFCVMCTFQWLAYPLHGILSFFHDYIVFDWGLAIILLVLCVRGVLHPITRFSQIRVFKFTKDMQRITPKMQKLKEKYKNDMRQQQAEMQRLYREEGVNPFGMLGCLPMLLQTPIWIALYAMIYFAFELRHEGAFFGVFQTMNNWSFLADLSQPDNFFTFNAPRLMTNLPLLGTVDSFNVLPILLGLVYFFHQKYLTPDTSGTTMSPEQESAQKMMKILFPVMFPFIMYNAPSGLALYFIVNSTIAIFESKHIRKKAEAQLEQEEALAKARGPGARAIKEPKPGGLLAKLKDAAERQQERAAQQQKARGTKPARPAKKKTPPATPSKKRRKK